MRQPTESQYYEWLRRQLLTLISLLGEIQSLTYDYQQELAKEIDAYKHRYQKESLHYVLMRGSYTPAGRLLPGEATHTKILEAVESFISTYEPLMKVYYPDELLSFGRETAILSANCQNLQSAFNVEYFDNPPPESQIDLFDESVKRMKNSACNKIAGINKLLESQKPKTSTRKRMAFVAKGFEPEEQQVNKQFQGTLDALGVPYLTGESYGCGPIPEKIRQMITASDVLIAIAQKRYIKPKGDGGTAPPWIIAEMTYAQTLGRSLIIIAEQGVDLANFPMEKEIIFFEKDQPESMQRATRTFLEALVAYGLVSTSSGDKGQSV